MALRSFASTVLPRFGCRLQPIAFEFSQSFERTFASVAPGYKYTKDHDWVSVEGDIATVGITDYAQQQLGELVFVELPDVGKTFEKDSDFSVVESVKAASDVHIPVSGTVTEVNVALNDNPAPVNDDPYGAGWIAKVKLSNPSELDGMLDAAAYEVYIGGKE